MPLAATQSCRDASMDLHLLTTQQEFAALRPDWERLHARCARHSVFLTHEWFDAAWQWRQRSAELYLVCCRRNEELVGVLPLIRERKLERHRGRVLEFLTVPDTQQCDLLIAEDGGPGVVDALADDLLRRQADWDVLRLRYLPHASATATTFASVLLACGSKCVVKKNAGNPFVRLDSSWEPYYATRSRRLKKANNLAVNRLRKAGDVRIEWYGPVAGNPTDVDRVVDTISGISARSWKTRTGNSLDNAGPHRFIERLSHLADRQGWLSVWILAVDREPVAMEYQLVANGNVYALRSDFDERHESNSPGAHLGRHLLERLFGRGLNRYLMGPGENEYKYRWAEGTEPIYEMTVYGRSLRGHALAAWEMGMKPIARSLRDRVVEITSSHKRKENVDVSDE
jgi:CelD/BcsL family acetyltransferase involved in cellulose biosynthesis